MDDIQVFKNDQFGELRTIVKNGEPWFVVADVCAYFGVTNRNRVMQGVDADDKGGTQMNTPGGMQTVAIVNESGLYSVLFALQPTKARGISDKYIEARQKHLHDFKRWITHDVIPTIRKHGAYMTPETIEKTLLNPDYIIQLATTLKGEMEKRKQLEAKVEKDKPLVQFAEHVGSTSDCLSIRQFSKIVRDESIKIGEKRLFQWLRDKKYLDTRNVAYQRYIESGYFNVREVTKSTVVGAKVFPQTLVTGKGQIYLLSKLREEFC